eukprot:jgi/Ulvmu1/10972/UM007_0151.1
MVEGSKAKVMAALCGYLVVEGCFAAPCLWSGRGASACTHAERLGLRLFPRCAVVGASHCHVGLRHAVCAWHWRTHCQGHRVRLALPILHGMWQCIEEIGGVQLQSPAVHAWAPDVWARPRGQCEDLSGRRAELNKSRDWATYLLSADLALLLYKCPIGISLSH